MNGLGFSKLLHIFRSEKVAFLVSSCFKILLEAYETGEEVRKLPCAHTYHRHPRASVASVNS